MITNRSGKPFIKKFKFDDLFYIYDVNTNQLVEVEKPVFDIIDDYEDDNTGAIESKHGNTYSIHEIRRRIREIKKAVKDHGLFSSFRPEKVTMGLRRIETLKKFQQKTGFHQLLLELTRGCNLNCSYCPTSGKYAGPEPEPVHMDKKTYRKAVDLFCKNPHSSEKPFISFYGGEPLKRFDLLRDTVEYVKQTYGKDRYSFNITTNGTLLNREIIDFFIANDVHILCSLDGPERVNDRYRLTRNNKGTFLTIMKNLEFLKAYDSDYFSRRVSISSVLTPPFDDFDEILNFFANNKILNPISAKGKIRTSFVGTEGTTFLEDFGLEESVKDLNRVHDRLVERLKESILEHCLPHLSFEKNTVYPILENLAKRPVKKLDVHMQPLGPCHIGLRRLFVRTNGDFYICERSGDNYKIGHVDTGYDYEGIAGYYRKLEEVLYDCKNCWAINHCERCWVQLGNLDEFTGEKKEDFCSYNKGMIETAFKVYVELLKKDPDCLKILSDGSGTGIKD